MVHVAIIGAYGSAGVAAAEQLLTAVDDGMLDDLHLSLIDDGEPGGLCILRGCMPSKDVLSAAGYRYHVRHDDRLGKTPTVDIEEMIAQKEAHISDFSRHRKDSVDTMTERPGVSFYHDSAHFVDPTTLAVGDEHLDVDHVIVATGSNPTIPSVPGIDTVDVNTSADVLEATTFPDSAVAIGFGFIGMELTPYLAEVGDVDITVIDRNDCPLSAIDPIFGETVLDLYEREFGIEVVTGAAADEVVDGGDEVSVKYRAGDGTSGTVTGDELFVFAGRTPNLDGLHLDAAGIEPREGWIADTMQTTENPRVYVAGDANGREPILHVAKEQGFTAADNIVATERGTQLNHYQPIIHRVVFSGLGIYPFARVGHSEASAEAAGYDVVTAVNHAESEGVFRVKSIPEGLGKLVVDAETGRVLGYLGLHYHADVFAKLAQVIVDRGLCVDELPDRAYHPTTPELLDGLIRETATAIADR